MVAARKTKRPRQLTRDVAIAELWSRGVLSWKLRPEQQRLKRELEKPDCQLAVYNISRRWGKTFTLVCYALEQALQRKQKIRYGAAFLTDLEEFILPAFNLILDDCPANLRPKYLASKKLWTFPNGSEVKLVGLDKNPQGLRGNAISKIIVDEAGFVSNLKHIYTSVIVPATAKQTDIKVVFLSTPPPTPDHYFVQLITKAQTQKNGHYLCLTIDDISDLPQEERKRLLDEVGGEHSPEAQREFFCKIIIDPTLALAPEFSESVHVKELTRPDYAKYWVAGDVGGVTDKTVLLLLAYDFKRDVTLVLDERSFDPQTNSQAWVAEAKAMEVGVSVTRHVDCHGQNQLDLMALGYACSLPSKDGDVGVKVNQIRMALQNGKVEIDPKCKLLVATLRAGTLNRNRTDLARTQALGHMDAFDALVYGLRHINRQNPFPLYDGRHPITIHVPERQQPHSQSAQVLKSIFTPR